MKWGVYRADFYGGASTTIGNIANVSLGPSAFQAQMPWFGTITGANSVDLAGDKQSVIDRENEWAKWYGIDYWNFDFYPSDPALGLGGAFAPWTNINYGLTRYLSSTGKQGIKFTLTVLADAIGTATPGVAGAWVGWNTSVVPYIVSLMKRSEWQTLNGRPLIYFYDYDAWSVWGVAGDFAAAVTQLRTAATNAGLANPYIVGLHTSTANFATIGFDAVSEYSRRASTNADHTYATLASEAEARWAINGATPFPVIPLCLSGWDSRSTNNATALAAAFGQTDFSYYTTPATTTQIANHHQAAVDWITNNPTKVPPETHIMTYAFMEDMENSNSLSGYSDGTASMKAIARKLGRENFHFPTASGLPAFGS